MRLGFLILLAWLVLLFASTANSAEIVDLPQDEDAWYISVVGPEGERAEILRWFDAHEGLADLKRQTHFCTPTYGSPIYNERYAGNIEATPTVRLQDAQGVVLYEVAGQEVPQTASGLFDGLRNAIRGKQRLLPWRRKMEEQCKPQTQPEPEPEPVAPFEPKAGPPKIEEPESAGVPIALVILACVIAVIGGATGGVVVAYKKEYSEAR